MDPKHDRQTGQRGLMGGSSDVQIETVKLVLHEDLSGDIAVWETNEFLFETPLIWLGADWTEGRT